LVIGVRSAVKLNKTMDIISKLDVKTPNVFSTKRNRCKILLMTSIMIIIVTGILTLSSFYAGYVLGSQLTTLPIKPKLPKIFRKKEKLGSIEKLTQRDIDRKGTRAEQTEKAMEETIDSLFKVL
jgi:hypothetical protein